MQISVGDLAATTGSGKKPGWRGWLLLSPMLLWLLLFVVVPSGTLTIRSLPWAPCFLLPDPCTPD